MTGNTRLTKGRSRVGCKQCRVARKKCDEARPTCGRCVHRRTTCDFDRPVGVRLGNRRRNTMSHPHPGAPTPSAVVPRSASLDEAAGQQGLPGLSMLAHGGQVQAGHNLHAGSSTYAGSSTHSEYNGHSHEHSGHALHAHPGHGSAHVAHAPPPHQVHPPHPPHPTHPPHTSHPPHTAHGGHHAAAHPSHHEQAAQIAHRHSGPSSEGAHMFLGEAGETIAPDQSPLAPTLAPAPPLDDLVALVEGEADPFHDLLKDLFGTALQEQAFITPLMTSTEVPGTEFIDPFADSSSGSYVDQGPGSGPRSVAPDDVRRRFNAPGTDPRSALLDALSEPIVATLSDTDVRLYYHFIDVQAPISVACAYGENPLCDHLVRVSLSSALAGRNEDNPAFHGLKALAATHRANLMDSTDTVGSEPFRVIAQTCRKTAYALILSLIQNVETLSPALREQCAGGIMTLVMLAVVDGNARLLPRLLDAYSDSLKLTDPHTLSRSEIFFIALVNQYQTWLSFSLTVVLDQPPTPSLQELLPPSMRYNVHGVDFVFGLRTEVCEKHTKLYAIMHEYRKAKAENNSVRMVRAQLEADELATAFGDELAADIATRASWSGSDMSQSDRRLVVTRIIQFAGLRVLLLQSIFQYPKTDYRIQECVRAALEVLTDVKWGTEAGLLIPLTLLSTAALDPERSRYRSLMRRLCWKGSAGPRAALETLDMVIQDPRTDWREAFTKVGAPMLI